MDELSTLSDDELAVEVLPTIQPYQYEPIKRSHGPEYVPSEEETSDEEPDAELNTLADMNSSRPTCTRTDNLAWCDCEHCVIMPTNTECVCCHEIGPIASILSENDMECITNHEGFKGNCLNKYVLQVSLLDYIQLEGPIDDNEPIHELYRHIAYRRFTRWIWFHLGKGRRKVIPACAVNMIRKAFPSESYAGFKYPRI